MESLNLIRPVLVKVKVTESFKAKAAAEAKAEAALEALKEMAADGTMAKISEKWFSSDVTTIGK